MEELERAHTWLCVDDAKSRKVDHQLNKCPQIERLAETPGEYAALTVAVNEYKVHHERVSAQHDAYIDGLANLQKNEVLLLFDFSPYKIGSNRDRTLASCTSVRTLDVVTARTPNSRTTTISHQLRTIIIFSAMQ